MRSALAPVAWLAAAVVLGSCGSFHAGATASPTLGYVPWLPLKPSGVMPQAPSPAPAPPYPIPAGTPFCKASQMQAVMGYFSAATGSNLDMPVLLRNTGSEDCVVEGYADVTVLDAGGGVLARAVGSAGQGTYFNDGPPVPILVKPGTQTFMNLTWYDCKHPQASQLAIDLPDRGGRVMVKFAVAGNYYMLCDGDPNYRALNRGPFSPVGIQWPPGPRYISLDVSINAPPEAKAGSTFIYYVTVTNIDTIDYVLTPCPDYLEILGPKTIVAEYELNCAPVGHVAPSASVTFEMRMTLPKTQPTASYDLRWSLADGRIANHGATALLRVT